MMPFSFSPLLSRISTLLIEMSSIFFSRVGTSLSQSKFKIYHNSNNSSILKSTWTTYQTFLAAMSSSSSDHVTPFVRSSVRNDFFDFAFNSLLGQDIWHLWSLKWPRTTVKVSHAMPKQMFWSLKLKYEIWIRLLQLKFDIECFAFDFWRLRLAFKSES